MRAAYGPLKVAPRQSQMVPACRTQEADRTALLEAADAGTSKRLASQRVILFDSGTSGRKVNSRQVDIFAPAFGVASRLSTPVFPLSVIERVQEGGL